ncbi:MAG: hypothetical protein Q9202_001594 [Teloschistes flavicans]
MMTSSSTPTATSSRHPFEQRVDNVKVSKTYLNSIIMDYLISEGYPSAAQKFASEANLQPTSAAESIHERVKIRDAIYAGDIQTAIERINELDESLLEKDSALYFALLRLQLVELVRKTRADSNDHVLEAIEFATNNLAPRAPARQEFLEDLEQTMALLIVKPEDRSPELSALLEPKLRKDVAQRVNEALLKEQGERTKAKLVHLVRMRAWAEKKAREAGKDLPEYISLGLEQGKDGHGNSRMHSNGDGEAMVA